MRQFNPTLECAKALDAADPMAGFRDRFYVQEGIIYMDGNSLGLMSKDAEQEVYKILDLWKTRGIGIWSTPGEGGIPHIDYPDILARGLAPLIGCDADEITVTNSTTINIHQAVATFYHPTPERYKILMDDLNFPTDHYAVQSQLALHGYDPADALKLVRSPDGKLIDEDAVIEAMTDDVALVLLPAVLYRSAQLINMERLAAAARERGIVIGFDLCHSIGSVPHNLKAVDADFAIWCNSKYLNGGPGAIAGLYINRKHFERIPGLTGWHGNRADTKFELRLDFEHEKRASGWQTGTQPLLSMAPLNGALKIYGETSMATVREKSLNLTAYMMYLIDEKLTKYGFSVGNPRDDAVRGGHVALEHEDAIRINEAIKAAGIVPDFRFPNVIRLAPIAFYTSYEDVYEMIERIVKIMEDKEYEKYENKIGTVA